ncbi:MAG: hypothetical protein MAG431_01329 [Chloroflexi bacterium]|nr:hypothetical protein [Chloroflexota bacterium]
MSCITDKLILVRGAGDLATGVMIRLLRSGFHVIALEIETPSAIRRTVAFANAVYKGVATVEDITGVLVDGVSVAPKIAEEGLVPVLVDPEATSLEILKPDVVVDAIMAKHNLGTHKEMAPTVIALGPGFSAGVDAHAVIETNRGHNLGRVILDGPPEADTHIPGITAGYGAERVVHAPATGTLTGICQIGDRVTRGQVLAIIENEAGQVKVPSPLDGVLRGLIYPGTQVKQGTKMADVDPRGDPAHCFSVSDKARAVGGGVLEAILYLERHIIALSPGEY